MNLGESIYRLRTQKNMSQGDLADALEVSRQSVSKWENNSAVPELEKLIRMAKLFGVSLDELVGNTPQESAPMPESAPTQASVPAPVLTGVTTGDLISIVLLVFGILIPVLVFVTGSLHGSVALMFLCVFALPLLITIGASHFSARNKQLFHVYLVYNLVICILILIMCSGAIHLGMLLCIVYLIPIWKWYCKWDE